MFLEPFFEYFDDDLKVIKYDKGKLVPLFLFQFNSSSSNISIENSLFTQLAQ